MNPMSHKRKSTRMIALEILLRIQQEQAYSQLVLDHFLQQHSLNSEDRRLVTEIVYGTLSHLLTIDFFLTPYVKMPLEKLDLWVKCLLELSVYQLYYLDRIPEHAIVNEAVIVAKSRGHQGISQMVNGVLRTVIRNKSNLQIPNHLPTVQRLSLLYSHPEWIVEKWLQELDESTTEQICKANNQAPTVCIRTNSLKINRQLLLEKLKEKHISAFPSQRNDTGILIKYDGNIAYHELYQQGYFTIQDESSMFVAQVVDPKPGMRVLDCCAAPAGKTSHLAELMNNLGEVWANDIHPHKQKLIDSQATRLGINIISTTTNDGRELDQHFQLESFDRILVDAPCSGLGVIRRKPDVRWKKTLKDIDQLVVLQYELLSTAARLLKPEGILVYSTCTIGQSENEQMVERFLQEHPHFQYDTFPEPTFSKLSGISKSSNNAYIQIFPYEFDSDGFFIARLKKSTSSNIRFI